MQLKDCFYLGYVSRIWKNSNKVAIKLDTDRPEAYKKLESVLIQMRKQDQQPIPFFISKFIKLRDSEITVELDLDMSTTDVDLLKSKQVYLPLDQLPELGPKQFYYHEIIGFEVNDKKHGSIGTVNEVIEHPINPLISISNKDKEILIPIRDEVIVLVNRKDKVVEVDVPEGLIDLYL